jgi:hypothetical protein
MSEEQAVAAPAAPVAPPAAPSAPTAESVPTAQNTAEQAPASQPGSETKPDTDGDDPEKRRQSRRFERRLDKAYRREAEARARADLLERQIAEIRAQARPADDPGAPRLENFKDIEEYAAAKAKHESEKALKEHQAKQRTEAQKREQAELVEAWEAKAERASSKYDDYDEVVGEMKPDSAIAVAIMEAENGEDIAYYLGKNLKEAERIAKLNPRAQIREIGRLEEKLLANPPTKPKTPSKAPAPINPVTAAAPVVSDVPSEADDIGQWIRKRQKQVHGRR